MPRIRQYNEKYILNDFIAEVNAQRARFGYNTQQELGEALDLCQGTVGNYLRNPDSIRLGTLRKMCQTLKLDPVVVLKVLGYTTADIKKFRTTCSWSEKD